MHTKFYKENVTERDHLGGVILGERIILRWNFTNKI
jgi:hypothetical protein